MKNALILCSGGLDSVVTAHYVAKSRKYNRISILFFDYGQRALNEERKASKYCAKKLNAEFIEFKIKELGKLSTSAINTKEKVKKSTSLKNTSKESSSWYVPFRNSMFISYALALAESKYVKSKEISEVFLGFKSEGKEPYPDTTKAFLKKINALSKEACIFPFKVSAPLITLDKEDIVKLGKKLNVNLSKTYSCYVGNRKHCGDCLACRLRKAGFYWANEKDFTSYLR